MAIVSILLRTLLIAMLLGSAFFSFVEAYPTVPAPDSSKSFTTHQFSWLRRTFDSLSSFDESPHFPQMQINKERTHAYLLPQSGDSNDNHPSSSSCTLRNLTHPVAVSHQLAKGRTGTVHYDSYMCSAGRVKGFIGTPDLSIANEQYKPTVVSIIIGGDEHTGEDIAINCIRHGRRNIGTNGHCSGVLHPAYSVRGGICGNSLLAGGRENCYLSRIKPVGLRCVSGTDADMDKNEKL